MTPLHSLPRIIGCLFIAGIGAGCGSSSSSSHATVVDVSGGQTVAASEPAEVREQEEADGPIALIKRVVGGRDVDGDGMGDGDDRCPDDPEDLDGFEDSDGCPEPDNDRDGILDRNDQCPNEPETINGTADEDGCPDGATNDAKKAFRDGATKFAQGDFAGARAAFERAYKLDPRDPILYNLAVTADRQGDRKAACQYYRQWRNTPQGSTAQMSSSTLSSCP